MQSLFEFSDDELTPEMQESLGILVDYLINTYNIDSVGSHKEVNCERNCPGDRGQEAVDRVREEKQCEGENCATGGQN